MHSTCYLQEQEDKTGLIWGAGTRGRKEDIKKEYRRVNMVEILCTWVWK
jgi:hypothetical protein